MNWPYPEAFPYELYQLETSFFSHLIVTLTNSLTDMKWDPRYLVKDEIVKTLFYRFMYEIVFLFKSAKRQSTECLPVN